MNGLISKLRVTVLLVLAIGWVGGCQSAQSTDQAGALYKQNRELQDELTRTRSALQAVESERTALSERIGSLESQVAEQAQAMSVPTLEDNEFVGIDGIQTVQMAGKIKVRIPGDVLFASGKATLKSSAIKTLDDVAKVIARQYADKRIRVEGYTDKDPIRKSKWKDNLELSMQRAAAVHRHLQAHGVEPNRLEAVGLGEWYPATSKSKSRRVDIVVVLDS